MYSHSHGMLIFGNILGYIQRCLLLTKNVVAIFSDYFGAFFCHILYHSLKQEKWSLVHCWFNQCNFLAKFSVIDGTDTVYIQFLACDYEAVTHAIAIDFLSVRPSVCPSVKRVYSDKTKAPSEKCSIMANRKSPTSFPMSLRWTSYVAPNPQRGPQKRKFDQ